MIKNIDIKELKHGEVSCHVNGGCWICSELKSSFNDHHIIPRNAGGTNGPQVHICSACHDAIHHASQLKLTSEDYSLRNDAKQRWITLESKTRSAFLINLIINSESHAKKSENKSIVLTVRLTGKDNKKLEYLSKRMKLSKQETLIKLIQEYVPGIVVK